MVGIGKKPSAAGIAEGGHPAAAELNGAVTLKSILDRARE
jgi:hypothetical protein